jgi:hypothetical protein
VTISIPKPIIQLLTVLAAAVILLMSVLAGAAAGKRRAQSQAVFANAMAVAQGLHYFYGDQTRFPSAIEFQGNLNLMLSYFTPFPPADIVSKNCPRSFAYQRPMLQAFKLSYCLPDEWEGLAAGWNELNENSVVPDK